MELLLYSNMLNIAQTHHYLKIIRKEIFTRRRNTEEKVTREIELHKKLSGHPNVVGFIDCFEDAQSIHIVLEYCGMKSLLHLLRKQKYLAEENVKRYTDNFIRGKLSQ